ncbi:hypothetical protein KR215_011559, partial [Drosophila sulfurigaster]
MSNPSMPPRRLAPGAATPVVPSRLTRTGTAPAAAPPAATAALTARLSGGSNTVTSSAITLEQAAAETMATPTLMQPMAATSCPDSPIRRVSSSLKNSALDFASRFFNKCKAATFTVDGATYTIGEYTQSVAQRKTKRHSSAYSRQKKYA